MFYNYKEIKDLIGKIFTSVIKEEIPYEDEGITFKIQDGSFYRLEHHQDCCESVYLKDVVGDLSDLEDTPILVAEERHEDGPKENDYDDGCTWTFYEFRTIKGSVTISFYGTSNGYYSETADVYFYEREK